MSESQIRFNIAYISVIFGLFVQFTGVVWFASSMNSELVDLSVKVDKLEKNLAIETEKTAPILFEYKYISTQLTELKTDIKYIKEKFEAKK